MMESTEFPCGQNGESKLLTLIPEFKITYLQKVKDPGIAKSPSWPNSPTVVRSDIAQDVKIPAYMTLGRKGFSRKVSDEEFGITEDIVHTKRSSDPQVEEIRSMISSIDFSKYRRKSKEPCDQSSEKSLGLIRRSISVQPQMNINNCNTGKKSFLDDIPPPPKTKSIIHSLPDLPLLEEKGQRTFSLELTPIKRSSRPVNSKLKELTERLRPSSAPPSPHRRQKPLIPYTAPPTTNFSFWKDPLPDTEEYPNRENLKDDAENRCDGKEFLKSLKATTGNRREKLSEMTKALSLKNCGYATLPRTKQITLNKSKSVEPRTLACLDLNTSLESVRNNDIIENENDAKNEDVVPLKKENEDKTFVESQRNNKFDKILRSPLLRQEECENNSEIIPSTTRRSSAKSAGKKREEFDLNFRNYGSLTYPHEKKEERRRSLPKIENLDKMMETEERISSPDHCNEFKNDIDKETKSEENSDTFANKKQSTVLDLKIPKTLNTSLDIETEKQFSSIQPRSAPVSSLEEEIRTIAKILDGKESLFLKLIQSSKLNEDRKYDTQNVESERSFSPTMGELESPSGSSELPRNIPDFRNAGRNSPSRLRAMTVPTTENNRNASISSISSPPQQKRYFKKRLRGPYGEMLEQEMSKSLNKSRPSYAKDLDFLKELENLDLKNNSSDIGPTRPRPLLRSSSHSFDETHSITVDGAPKRKTSANIPIVSECNAEGLRVPTTSVSGTVSEPILHIRSHSDSVKTSSTWNVDTIMSGMLKQPLQQDTRTHIVGELYETELSYVESLQIIVRKYMIPLKSTEHAAEIEISQVDQIFCRVPEILKFHENFLDTLKTRLGYWDTKQKIGDVFVDVFTRPPVVDTYIEFINNWKSARDAIKSISLAKPAFAKFLEHTSREHKGKLTLDALLIMPVQRIPRYELLIKELLKHTPMDHPDYKLLLQAQREVHDLAVKINKVEREALQQEQMLQKLREVEHLIEGVVDLTQGDRAFIRNDFVLIPGGLGMKKERCLFLFSDMLLISSIKKKGGAIRKTSLAVNSSSCGSLESNKYKLLMRTSLHNVDIVKKIDEPCVTKFMKEISTLENDVLTMGKITDLIGTLSFQHQALEETVKEILTNLNKQLTEKQASCSQMMSLELSIGMEDEIRNLTFIFPNPEQRMTWEIAFSEAKGKLDNSFEKTSPPEFLCSLPLRKTRAGLQITCAAAVIDSCQSGLPDLWICSSDGYVGQVSVLTFQNEPVISSCVCVSNARILCIAAVPGLSSGSLLLRRRSTLLPYLPGFKYEKLEREEESDSTREKNFPLDSDSDDEFIDATDDDFTLDDTNIHQSTMWLGTEDGWIYVYNCADTKLKKAKLKIQHSSCIYDILHVEGQVFVSLANGEIVIYCRDPNGFWNASSPQRVQVATDVSPISKMMLIKGNLWCSTLNSIVIINTSSLEVEHTFQVASDLMRHITSIVPSSHGVWISVQSSPVIHLYDFTSYDLLLDVNISSPVTKLLMGYGDIIKKHKLSCLRVSSLCVEKDLLWIGTSAGVILNLTMSSINLSSSIGDAQSNIEGLLHGHSGHVRFLKSICASSGKDSFSSEGSSTHSGQLKSMGAVASTSSASPYSAMVISGGDGYEDFGSLSESETAGRDDSTNHLLMWRV